MFKNYDAVSYLYEKRLAKENEPFAEKFIASIDNANNIEIKVTDLIIIIKALNILPLYQSQIAFNKLYSVNPMLANRILEMADELPNKSEFEHRNQLRQLVARYVFLIQSSILTRVFSKDRRKFILNALGTNIPANINEVISRILKELECNFKVNGGIANIFSLKNKLIPYIFKHASRVKYASLKSEIDGITGQKTQEAPYYSTYALYSLDVILQLINKHNKEFLVDSLDLKGLDFTVTPMKVEEFKPKINNIFNIEFVNDGKIHGSIEDINSVINLNS